MQNQPVPDRSSAAASLDHVAREDAAREEFDRRSRAVRRLFSVSLLLTVFAASLLAIVFFTGDLRSPAAVADRAVTPRGELLPSELETIRVFDEAAASVVHITSVTTVSRSAWGFRVEPREVVTGTGSGFVWDAEGHIVTNYHVIREAVMLDRQATRGEHVAWVTFGNESTERFRASLVGIAGYKDLAVLKVDAPKELLRPIAVGTSKDLRVGQKTIVIGNPFGLDQTLTTGVVSALGREIQSVLQTTIRDVIQTDAAINPGNSGGPLLDSAGRLIGVNTAIYSPSGAYAGIGFAIPVDTVLRIVPDLIAYGSPRAPILGIELNGSADRQLHLDGVMVWEVGPGSGAEAAGLQGVDERARRYGDIIVAIDGKPVGDEHELTSVLESYRAGEKVEVELVREYDPRRRAGKHMKLQVTLSSGK
ncbi:MAG: trypsin-like peptidase domain-containing protein [Planctomycetes bacterium]|nr:trypsin-like peptidase domain-containing protein [Planctomycetota bacterium]